MELLFQLVSNMKISLWVVHIPGKMNIIADLLSCKDQTLSTEWLLNPKVTRHMFCLWGSPQVELFATQGKTKLPTLALPVPYSQALGMDALSLPW